MGEEIICTLWQNEAKVADLGFAFTRSTPAVESDHESE